MKILIAALCALTGSLAHASDALPTSGEAFCSLRVIRAYRPIIDQPQFYDKYKHCAMSCVLAFHCGRVEAGAVGIAKELADLFNPGDAELKDLRADNMGISLVTRGYSKSASDCYTACHRLFPKPE